MSYDDFKIKQDKSVEVEYSANDGYIIVEKEKSETLDKDHPIGSISLTIEKNNNDENDQSDDYNNYDNENTTLAYFTTGFDENFPEEEYPLINFYTDKVYIYSKQDGEEKHFTESLANTVLHELTHFWIRNIIHFSFEFNTKQYYGKTIGSIINEGLATLVQGGDYRVNDIAYEKTKEYSLGFLMFRYLMKQYSKISTIQNFLNKCSGTLTLEKLDDVIKSITNSNFNTFEELIKKVAELYENKTENTLIEEFGINLNNEDTGSILGLDANGGKELSEKTLINAKWNSNYAEAYDKKYNNFNDWFIYPFVEIKGQFTSIENKYCESYAITPVASKNIYYDVGNIRFYWYPESWGENADPDLVKKIIMFITEGGVLNQSINILKQIFNTDKYSYRMYEYDDNDEKYCPVYLSFEYYETDSEGNPPENPPTGDKYTDVYNEYYDKLQSALNGSNKYTDVYNEYYDKFSNSLNCVYPEYYLKLINGLAEDKTKKQKTEGAEEWNIYNGKKNDNNDIITGSAKQPIHELRNTPGYTNYVRDVRKDLSGNITSAFLKRYYSNIDAEIYMNGQWVEDIGSIQWTIDQQTMPIYGYNSYVFDAIAQGSRIIQGAFTVAFTRPRSIEEFVKKSYQSINDSSVVTPANYEQTIQRLAEYQEGIKLHRNGSELISNKQHLPVWMNDKFDIDIVCGEKEAIGGEAVHIILKECWITRIGSLRTKDGGIAEESYSFLAKDYKTIGLSEYKGAY